MLTFRTFTLWLWLGYGTLLFLMVSIPAQLGTRTFARKITHWMAQWWGRGMLRAAGARARVEGLPKDLGQGPYVIMSNHRSHMDTPLLIAKLPLFFGFIVKAELDRIPLFRTGMKMIGCVPVKRARTKSDHAVLNGVAQTVAGGQNIVIFPEGTRAPSDEFLPFKKGGVVLAIKAGVPILPVAVCGTQRVLPPKTFRVTAGQLVLRVGSPIPTSNRGLDERDAILVEVKNAIKILYAKGI